MAEIVIAPWCSAADLTGPCVNATFEDGVLEAAILIATRSLYHLTKRRWPGPQTDTIRPTRGRCLVRRADDDDLLLIRLPMAPVVSVTTVKLGGATLVAGTDYNVVDGRYLQRLGDNVWPGWQDTRLPTTAADTLEITYVWGRSAPADARAVAAILTCQLALAMNPRTGAETRLPKRVTTITRQGVTMAIVDPLTLFDKGMTGLVEVDLWVAAMNQAQSRGASVMVVGRERHNRRVS